MKGFSILTIVCMHLLQKYMTVVPGFIIKASSFGGTGVHIFLFCSGFGLSMSQMKKKFTYRQFIRRRFFKVYIPYIVVVFVSALLPIMYNGDRWRALLSHVFLYKMFFEKYEISFGIQLWFVSTIIQYYLIFIPIYSLMEREGNRKFFLLCSVASLMWWIFIVEMDLDSLRVCNSFFLQYLWEFSLGMITASYLESNRNIAVKTYQIICTAILGSLIAAGASLKGGVLKVFNDVPAMAGYMSIILLIYMLNIKTLKTVIYFLSRISYEWYLLHILVFEVSFYYLEDNIGLIGTAIISVFLSVFIAYLYNKLVAFFLSSIDGYLNKTDEKQLVFR